MSKPKLAKYFSSEFFELADRLSKHPERTVTVEFATAGAAIDFRQEFYSFRKCAETEGLIREYPELCAVMAKLKGTSITFQHKDYTPSILALKAALEKLDAEENPQSRESN